MMQTETNESVFRFETLKYTWSIRFGSVTINQTGTVPNAFQRLMYKVLLGWEVRTIT